MPGISPLAIFSRICSSLRRDSRAAAWISSWHSSQRYELSAAVSSAPGGITRRPGKNGVPTAVDRPQLTHGCAAIGSLAVVASSGFMTSMVRLPQLTVKPET